MLLSSKESSRKFEKPKRCETCKFKGNTERPRSEKCYFKCISGRKLQETFRSSKLNINPFSSPSWFFSKIRVRPVRKLVSSPINHNEVWPDVTSAKFNATVAVTRENVRSDYRSELS